MKYINKVYVGERNFCGCPIRKLPPLKPKEIPFKAEDSNISLLENCLLKYYGASSFNCCENKKLPLITSLPPLKLYVNPYATPKAIFKAAKIPLHFMKKIKEELDRFVKLGVIEPVPENTPVK